MEVKVRATDTWTKSETDDFSDIYKTSEWATAKGTRY